MKKIALFTLCLVLPWLSFAQPVEEEISTTSPTYEIEVIESPQQIEQVQEVVPVTPLGATEEKPQLGNIEPIGEVVQPGEIEPTPETIAPAAKSGDTWGFSAGAMFRPLYIISTQGSNGIFASVIPNASITSDFLTSSGKKFSFNLDYTLFWNEYYNKADGTLRYFEHDTVLGLGLEIGGGWAASLGLNANYSFDVQTGVESTPTWMSFNKLHFTNTSIENTTFTLGYGADYYNTPKGAIYASSLGLPSDTDDIRSSNFGFNPGFGASSEDIVLSPNTFTINNKARLGASYAIPNGPKIAMDYDYVFGSLTNDAQTNWKGHFINVSISQDVWKGGNISLSNQLRLQNFQSATVASSGSLKRAQRNRTHLTITHKLNDSVGFKMWYRLQMTSDNSTSEWTPKHYWYLQTSYSF